MKKVVVFALLAALVIITTGCTIGNRQIGFDTKQTFNWAVVKLGNGELIEGQISSWRDFDNSDTVQFTMNGVTYLTHYSNVILTTEQP